jgi:hypothetical protein
MKYCAIFAKFEISACPLAASFGVKYVRISNVLSGVLGPKGRRPWFEIARPSRRNSGGVRFRRTALYLQPAFSLMPRAEFDPEELDLWEIELAPGWFPT